jgi:REP element-mobilizing transposase RayT
VAFVFMRDHVHLIVNPREAVYDMAVIKKAVKRPFAGRLKDHLVSVGSPLLKSLTVRERPGVFSSRFWQEGGGHDRNLWNPETLVKAIDYVHCNPVRRGPVRSPDLWRWSSWNYHNNPRWKGDPDLLCVHGLPAGW